MTAFEVDVTTVAGGDGVSAQARAEVVNVSHAP